MIQKKNRNQNRNQTKIQTCKSLFVPLLITLLAGCGGGGGGGGGGTPMVGASPGALLSGLYADYHLTAAGQEPVQERGTQALSCDTGCNVLDLRTLANTPGTGMRGGFTTIIGEISFPVLTETENDIAVTAGNGSFRRYGFWAEHGYAAMELGNGNLQATENAVTWRGPFQAAQAWVGGEASMSNPTGSGSAVWRGIAEAAKTTSAPFERLSGSALLTIPNLSRPQVNVRIDLDDGGVSRPLQWNGLQSVGGSFNSSGTNQPGSLQGRFQGSGHEEAWGVFDTPDYIGAFGAKREPEG